MKTNKVACFYNKLNSNDTVKAFTQQCFPLIDYWKKSWESNGWETHVLNEDYIKDNYNYKALKFDDFAESILCKYSLDFDCEYTRACYMRWLAYHKFAKEHESIFWADYDVINYGFTPENDVKNNSRLSHCSCAGKLNTVGSKKIINTFVDIQNGEYEPKTLAKIINKHPDKNLAGKFSDMMVTASLVALKVHHPLISREAREVILHNLNKPFIIHYHNGIFSKADSSFKSIADVSDILHVDGLRLSRLEAIHKLENLYNIEGY